MCTLKVGAFACLLRPSLGVCSCIMPKKNLTGGKFLQETVSASIIRKFWNGNCQLYTSFI